MLGLLMASRPMGLGAGVFTLMVFLGLSLALCFVGKHSTTPAYEAATLRACGCALLTPRSLFSKYYTLAVLLPGIVAAFLVLAPREGDLRTSPTQVRRLVGV